MSGNIDDCFVTSIVEVLIFPVTAHIIGWRCNIFLLNNVVTLFCLILFYRGLYRFVCEPDCSAKCL